MALKGSMLELFYFLFYERRLPGRPPQKKSLNERVKELSIF